MAHGLFRWNLNYHGSCCSALKPSAPVRKRYLPVHTAATPTQIPEGNANGRNTGRRGRPSASVSAEAAAKRRRRVSPEGLARRLTSAPEDRPGPRCLPRRTGPCSVDRRTTVRVGPQCQSEECTRRRSGAFRSLHSNEGSTTIAHEGAVAIQA